jgi:hypothetical protein
MKNKLQSTADKMNDAIAATGRNEKWELDTDTFSNSIGSWFCGNVGGVTDAKTMRDATKHLLENQTQPQPDKAAARPWRLSLESAGHANCVVQIGPSGFRQVLADQSPLNSEIELTDYAALAGFAAKNPDLISELQGWVNGVCNEFRYDHWKAVVIGAIFAEHAALVAVEEAAKAVMHTAHQSARELIKYGPRGDEVDYTIHCGRAKGLNKSLAQLTNCRLNNACTALDAIRK